MQAMKLDLEYKDEKITALNKELEELGTGAGATDEEVAALKRAKIDLEMRLKEQVREDSSMILSDSPPQKKRK